jgi:SM-20-related protein
MIENIIQDLLQSGYAVVEDFLSPPEVVLSNQEIASIQQNHELSAAGLASHERVDSIRGDWTYWWELEKLTPHQEQIFQKLEQIKTKLNEALFLGLWDFEGHYAVYPPGTFYKKHVDRLQHDDRRKLSVVIFFNQNWNLDRDGGGLEIESPSGDLVCIAPEAGKMVCFLSDQIPHQVLKTNRERKSFAGWFRTRP